MFMQSHTTTVVKIGWEGNKDEILGNKMNGNDLKLNLHMKLRTWIDLSVDSNVDDFYINLYKQTYSYPNVAFSGNIIQTESKSDSDSDEENFSLD